MTNGEVRRSRPAPSTAPGTDARPRVLLAEDDEVFRALVASQLRRDGFEVVEAENGAELLERVEAMLRTRPDGALVIVTDVNMPGLGGLDVLAVLRCADVAMPVVLITAFGDDEVRAEARDLGAVAVLSKPFDGDALRAAVADATLACPGAA